MIAGIKFEMDGKSLKNFADLMTNQDAATKNYVDKNIITVNEGVVHHDIKLAVGSGLTRKKLDCSNVNEG